MGLKDIGFMYYSNHMPLNTISNKQKDVSSKQKKLKIKTTITKRIPKHCKKSFFKEIIGIFLSISNYHIKIKNKINRKTI